MASFAPFLTAVGAREVGGARRRGPDRAVAKMAALTSLALVGAVPMTAEEHERSRLLPFVHQLLNSEMVRRVIDHWRPPQRPETADAGEFSLEPAGDGAGGVVGGKGQRSRPVLCSRDVEKTAASVRGAAGEVP